MSELFSVGICFAVGLATMAPAQSPERLRLAWPTANRAYAEGAPLEAFIQPTVSGLVDSGLFGCVRSSGTQFHEALDLKPLHRDARGEATDEVFAVLDGVVRHVNAKAGQSSYGRYVVLEHPEAVPAVYTLYAHLATVDAAVRPGARVITGQVLGVMGRSAGGYTIPPDRAHLHFEIGLRLTDAFQPWYDWKKFGSRNEHGPWNGMNLAGFDPLAFYDAFRAREVDTFADHLRQLPPVVKVRVAVAGAPDFVRRYPALVTTDAAPLLPAGWEVTFDAFGVPFAWTPLDEAAVDGYRRGEARVVWADEAALRECRCRKLVVWRKGRAEPGADLASSLQLLFGLRR